MKNSRKIFTVASKQNENEAAAPDLSKRSLHKSLKWVIVLAQCFGQMPVRGISKLDSRFLKFRWRSWRCLYCLLNCTGAGLLTLTFLYTAGKEGIDIFLTSAIMFHSCTLMITIFFLKLATEWPQIMNKWSMVEFSMRSYGWPKRLHTRIIILITTVMSAATIEYTMVKARNVLISIKYKHDGQELFEYYCTITLYPHVFAILSFSIWKGIVLQIINILITFAWSFNDVFIMIMSTAVAVRFKQVTSRLQLLLKTCKTNNVNVWREAREDYNRLSKLTKNLDNALSYIVLTSFASNLFFILMQLFNSLRPMKDTLEKVYFFFSFGLLILRTICVSLYGAWIYDESKEPMSILNSIPSEVYNIEVKRFIEQIKFDTVALTGKNFFYVTRGLILSMAGAIVTYELVLIQFNENLLRDGAPSASNNSQS